MKNWCARSKLIIVLAGATPLFAGQSLVLAGNTASSDSLPSYSHSLPSRVEFYLHDWALSGNTLALANANAIGLRSFLYNPGPSNLQLALYNEWEADPVGICQVQIGTANSGTGLPTAGIYVRFQHDPSGLLGVPKTDYCEMWDTNGNRIAFSTIKWTKDNNSSGTNATIGGGNDSRAMAFFRIHTTLVPPNSRMPITSDNTSTMVHWKFDGDLSDSSGNRHTAQLSNGRAVYVNTPYQNVISVIQTAGAPSWSNWVTMQAGQNNQLDATASFSQADNSGSVTCLWTQVSGPTTVALANPTSCSPTVAGLVFGDYVFQLQVTDSSGAVSVATQDVGAVAMDANGVVINSDPNADIIFGPMIAFGKNPWGLHDANSKFMVDAQYNYQNCCTPPKWATTNGQGTVSYTFCGVGGCSSRTGTKLDAILTATALSLDVDNVSVLDLSSLPSVPTTAFVDGEVMLICGTTGTSGRQTLTVCYDGRGVQGGGLYATAAVQHQAGANVGQFKISGASTLFTSDPNTPLCPSGSGSSLPAPLGRVVYSAGNVTVTPGSPTMVGVGTSWTNANGIYGPIGLLVRIAGTYSGGTPFAFIATITGLTDSAHITLSRNYPADADAGTFSYSIVSYRYASLNYTRPDGSTGRTLQNALQVCIGDLQMGGIGGHDYLAIDQVLMTGQNFSYKDSLGIASPYGPNFYGAGLAARAFYLRSGYGKALELANFIDDYWIRDPEVDDGYVGAQPLLMGGGVIGAFADLMLNPNTPLTSSDFRGFLYAGEQLIALSCDGDDTRDTGYERAITALGAMFDSNPSFRAKWLADLEAIYDQHDVGGNACKQADNSFSNAYLVDANVPPNPPVPNFGYAPLVVTNGSPVATDATGNGITPDRCNIAASGTLIATGGSAAVSDPAGNFINPNPNNNGRRLIIHATQNSGATPYVTFFSYQFTSGTSITLNGLWPGDSGSFTYVIENTGYPTAMGTSQADHAGLQQIWACTWNSPSQITLDRPWTGASGTVNLYQSPGRPLGGYAIGGYGQQPYMLGGMAVLSLNYAAQVNDPNYQAKWLALAQAASTYMWSPPSYDPYTQGIQYGVGYGGCEQQTPINSGSGYVNGTSQGNGDWCQSDLTPQGGISVARGLAVEALNSLTVYYRSNPTPAMQAFGDTVYGSIWASSAYTTGGVYSAPDNIQASNCYPLNLAYYKWPGFCFGMAMSHQWPAARVGGVEAAQNEVALVEIDLASVPSAEKVEIIVLKPSGAKSTYACASSPCKVMVDKRQGTHIVNVNYLSAAGKLLQSKRQFLEAGPSRRAVSSGLRETK